MAVYTREKGIGTVQDSAATDSTSEWSVVSLLKGIWLGIKTIWYRSSFLIGNVTIAASSTAQQLSSVSSKSFCIQASHSNTGVVYVGNANTVSGTVHAFVLTPGSSTPTLDLSNLNLIWIYGTKDDKISYGGEA
jgi:hypothetical protein